MDELDFNAMLNTMEKERREDPTYFQETLFAAVVVAARVLDDNFDEFCSFCSSLIEWALRQNKPETAFYISKAMVKLFQKETPNFNYAISLYYLGFSYFDLEKFSQAKAALSKCQKILKIMDFKDKSTDLRIKIIDLLGRCYYHLGVFDDSENALKEALELKAAIDTTDSPKSLASVNILPTLIHLSKTQIELNKYSEALDHANLALSKSTKDNEYNRMALKNRGECYMNTENYPRAIEDFEKIDIEQASKTHQATWNSYLGHCYLSIGSIESALRYHNTALDIYKGKSFVENVKLIQSQQYLGINIIPYTAQM